MGDAGRIAGHEALDEMGRAVTRMLAAVAEPPVTTPPVVADGWRELPDAAELDAALASAEAGWADWQRRLAALLADVAVTGGGGRGDTIAGSESA